MKFTKDDIAILKNFAQINPGIELKKGSVLKTIHKHKVLLAEANLSQAIPEDFVIWDLNNLLGIHSQIFDDPDIEFTNEHLTIKDGRRKLIYRAADKSTITVVPEKPFTLPESVVKFDLDAKEFASLKEFARIFQYDNIVVRSDSGRVLVEATDLKNPASDKLSIDTGVDTEVALNVIFKVDNLKLLDGGYDVEINKMVGVFTNKDKPVKYWAAIEKQSTVG